MIRDIAKTAARCSDTLVQDAVGAIALGVIFVVSLHMPAFF
ncbi:hypothetical protein [Pseudoprimorskyibacter insulae]|uniref:Uncharacterized protein n=1 Tax=Pseudoprimorskyibacter insulae TaxID=1695997 RepID=A0A2R8AXT6_9RHOB|nr:hypothetical protein [Pseudoprimorskyibacter insulae]SPF80808.1 hypothetical protein PRI8871_02620 [Pseudoprimorskyibacter insulae]